MAQFTIQMWVNLQSPSRQFSICGKTSNWSNGWAIYHYGLYTTSPEDVQVLVNSWFRSDQILAEKVVAVNTWTHLSVTFDGDSIRTYVGGNLQHEIPCQRTLLANTAPLRVGTMLWTDANPLNPETKGDWGHSDLEIADFRLYNYALTPEQIAESFGEDLTGHEDGLLIWFRFDEPFSDLAQPVRNRSSFGAIHDGRLVANATVEPPRQPLPNGL